MFLVFRGVSKPVVMVTYENTEDLRPWQLGMKGLDDLRSYTLALLVPNCTRAWAQAVSLYCGVWARKQLLSHAV